jgi:uncharacterized membrane protein YqjE
VEATREPAARSDGPAAQPPSINGLAADHRAAFGARAHLVELEARRAALSAAWMLGFAVAAALLGVTAWLLLVGGLMTAAIRLGAPWWIVTLVALVLHSGAAWLLVARIRGLVNNVTFAATRRTLSSRRPTGAAHGGVAG